jgi:hypothetical protein
MTKETTVEVEKAVNYIANMIRNWINDDATVAIPDPQFDLIRQLFARSSGRHKITINPRVDHWCSS